MSTAIPIELYDILERKLGKEDAREVGKVIERTFEAIEEKAKEQVLLKKVEIKEELKEELATKGDILLVRQEIELVRQEMQTIKVEIEGRIDKLNQKFNFMIALLIIAITLMNPVAAEILKGLLIK